MLLLAYYFCFTTEIFHVDVLKCMKSCPTLFGSILGIEIPLLRSFKLGGLIKLFLLFLVFKHIAFTDIWIFKKCFRSIFGRNIPWEMKWFLFCWNIFFQRGSFVEGKVVFRYFQGSNILFPTMKGNYLNFVSSDWEFSGRYFFLRFGIFLPELLRIKISLLLCKHSTANKHPAIFRPHSISG